MNAGTWKRFAFSLPLAIAIAASAGADDPAEDKPNTHNMLVVGEKAVYLSHLPMFHGVSGDPARFSSPHRFQVILEAAFVKDDKDVTGLYTRDRKRNPSLKMYTLKPEELVLSRLFRPPGKPALGAFTGTVFRGHLERGGEEIPGLEGATVEVRRVVYADELDPATTKPENLTYLLFGKGKELFLAHRISGPPDFDQVLSAEVKGDVPTAEELGRGVEVVVLDRPDTAVRRLQAGERVAGRGHVTGAHRFLDLKVRAGRELYFENGELQIPHTFDTTPEEQKAGF